MITAAAKPHRALGSFVNHAPPRLAILTATTESAFGQSFMKLLLVVSDFTIPESREEARVVHVI